MSRRVPGRVDPAPWTVRTVTAAGTARWGERAGALAAPGDAFLLSGPVGVGKSVLASGLLRGLGVPGPHPSPTFTLVRTYRGRLPAVHVDLYRLGPSAAAEDLGWEDLLGGGSVAVVEWAEYLGPWRPADGVSVHLVATPAGRRLAWRPLGPHGAALIDALRGEARP